MASAHGPVVCAVIARTRHKMIQFEIQEAAKRGAKLIELRLDFLTKPPDYKRLLADKPCPLIATFRRTADGGRFAGDESQRLMLIRQAIVAGFDWIDLETDIADKVPRFGKVKRIVSYHNLHEVPDDLEVIYERMCRQDADVVKIAVTITQSTENVRLLKILEGAKTPTVALGMGDLGTVTRILAGKYGSPFSYAAFNKERAVAPGILSFHELKKIYHFEQLNKDAKVFGVIGDPVSHSLSPLIHNSAFAKLGINAVYVPFRVPRGELANFLMYLDRVPIRGYSVTIPHKEAVARMEGERDAAVDATGAANTLVKGEKGWCIYNTDAQAALESLEANLPAGPEGQPTPLNTRTVLIVGAGGVARALAHVLHRAGANITITNRTAERAAQLAQEVGCRHIDWEGRHNILCDTLINCTSVGMFPNVDESPIHHSVLKPGLFVFDTIYTPETTLLIREAQQRGCFTLTGVDMFVRQAAAQFRLFTGQEPPIELMTQVVRRALSPVNYEKLEGKG